LNLYFDVWLALGLLFFASYLMSHRTYLSMSFPIFGVVTLSSLAALISVSLAQIDLGFSVLSGSALIAAIIVFTSKPGGKKAARAAFFSTLYSFGVAAISLFTQVFGVAGVGFSDGFTIMRTSLWIQGVVGESPLDGSKGLKRGWGMSSVQALGDRGEYLVGFVPVIFIVAIICSLLIIFRVLKDRSVAIALSATTFVVLLSTEAVLRHLYLMNSHSLIWLALAVLILILLDQRTFEMRGRSLVAVLPVISAIAFARFDALWVIAPLLVPILLATYRSKRTNGLLILVSALGPLATWLLIAVTNFPLGGPVGIGIVVFGVVLAFLLTNAIIPVGWLEFGKLKKIYFWLALGITLLAFLLANATSSLQGMFANFLLGEGLWGATIICLVGLALIASILKRKKPTEELFGLIHAAGFLMISLLFAAKLGDGFEDGILGGGLVRSGWGDSINRMIVVYVPFAVLFVANFVGRLTRKSS